MNVRGPCKHRWDIEPPGGPTSKGRCRRCGEEREFSNVGLLQQAEWGQEGVRLGHTQAVALPVEDSRVIW